MNLNKSPVILLFLLNLGTGVFFMNEGLFHQDSVFLARAVEESYRTQTLQPAIRGRYGSVIVNVVTYLPFYLAGRNADYAIRFTSVLFHALSITSLFLFVRELLRDERAAFFSSFLCSFVPLYFIPDTYGKEHGLSMFFFLTGLYLLLRGRRTGSLVSLMCSGVCAAAAVTVREAMIIGIFVYLALFISPEISVRPFKITLARARCGARMIAVCILPMALFLAYAGWAYAGKEMCVALTRGDHAGSKFLGFFSSVLPMAARDITMNLSWPLCVLFPLGVLALVRAQRVFAGVFLVFWFSTIFYFGNISCYCARYLDVVIVPVCIGAAVVLSGWRRPRALIAAVLSVVVMWSYMYPMLDVRSHFNGEKRFARFVGAMTEPNAYIIAVDDSAFIEYYGERATLTYPVGGPRRMSDFIRTLRRLLAEQTPVYIVSSAFDYDLNKSFRAQLYRSFALQPAGSAWGEDYHTPEYGLNIKRYYLWRIMPRPDAAAG